MTRPTTTKRKLAKIGAFLLFALTLTFVAPISNNVVADIPTEFSNTSIYGTYAVYTSDHTHAGIDSAFSGLYMFDGVGSFSGKLKQNLPLGPDNTRVYEDISISGSYVLYETGLGTFEHDGITFDLAVHESPRNSLTRRAMELYAISRTAINGGLISMILTRLPDAIDFARADLSGLYSIKFNIGDHGSAGVGMIEFNEQGEVTGACIITSANQNDGLPHDAQVVQNAISGSYTMGNDGWGVLNLTLTNADGQTKTITQDFIVIAAEVYGAFTLVTDLHMMQREAANDDGELITMKLSRVED